MMLPYPFVNGIALILYGLLLFVIGSGLWQFVKSRYLLKEGDTFRFRSLVPLGAVATVIGFIGLLNQYRIVFKDIEAAGYISQAIVAAGLHSAFGFPILGLLTLAISFVFKYVNPS
jgi:hypothetical protein